MKTLLPLFLFTTIFMACSASTPSLPEGTPVEELTVHQSNRTSHSITFDGKLIAPYASVPDVVLLSQAVGAFPAGTLLIYFNDTSQDETDGQMSFGMIYSVDEGKTWSDRITVPIESEEENFIAADASVVQLEDGTLRLYFYALNPKGDLGRERDIFASSSKDGLSFSVEAKVYHTPLQVNNPEVVWHKNQWYLFLIDPETHTAGFSVSEDPLEFSDFQDFPLQGILGATSDGEQLLIYGCSKAITEWSLEDGELNFIKDTPFTGCDPSPYFDVSGVLHMVAKEVKSENTFK